MTEFRKKLTENEINTGLLLWSAESDTLLHGIIPQTLVFDLSFEGQIFSNLSVDWQKRSLFIGDPLFSASLGSEIVLEPPRDKGNIVVCRILPAQDKMVIRKKLSHQEYQGRYLKWYAREDSLYERFFSERKACFIEIAGKITDDRMPDFEKRRIKIGDVLRFFHAGDNIVLRWKPEADDILLVEPAHVHLKSPADGAFPLRSLVSRLLSRPLAEFNEGEVKALLVLLEENKKLWERLFSCEDENRRLKEQVNMLESLFEQFTSSSFFVSKKEFESWVASHVTVIEKGLRILYRNYSVTLKDGRKRRIDVICQDKKGVLLAVQILYDPDAAQLTEAINLFDDLKENICELGRLLTGGQFASADIRSMIVSNKEKNDLVEQCMQKQIKLCLVKSGCLIDLLE